MAEHIISGKREPIPDFLPGVALRTFASTECGTQAMSTGTVTFGPGQRLPYHKHWFSEAVTVLEGEALFEIEGRCYHLQPLDCIHIPAGIAHETVNASDRVPLVAHWAFASAVPTRDVVKDKFPREEVRSLAQLGNPEYIARFTGSAGYELSEGTKFYDLFAGRYGAVGICGGYGRFEPASSLPCHIHDYDESITIVEGEATCEVMGKRYRLSGCDTAFIPQGMPHRFLNESAKSMAMVWVYAGSEPMRSIVDVRYCAGSLPWKKPQ